MNGSPETSGAPSPFLPTALLLMTIEVFVRRCPPGARGQFRFLDDCVEAAAPQSSSMPSTRCTRL